MSKNPPATYPAGRRNEAIASELEASMLRSPAEKVAGF
jgi:hypothetical protein